MENNMTGKILLLLIGVIILMLLLKGKNSEGVEPQKEPTAAEEEAEKPVTDTSGVHIKRNIRVLLKTTDFKDIFHENVILAGDTPMTIVMGELEKELPAGAELSINSLRESYPLLTGKGEECEIPDKMTLTSNAEQGIIKILTIGRYQGTPGYRGKIEVLHTKMGYVIVNELPMEEYLYSVVTSEMPSDYPLEALKAQAVCARSYAAKQMLDPGYKDYQADVDDSSSFQVYNNVEESENAKKAVKATEGQTVFYQGNIASTYYFSTSCGKTTNDEVWRNETGEIEERKPYLISKQICDEKQVDYEAEEPWYRWNLSFYPSQLIRLRERIKERFQKNPNLILSKEGEDFVKKLPQNMDSLGDMTNLQILHTNEGGLVDELLLCFGEVEIKLLTEYNIRYILAAENAVITKQNGEIVSCGNLIPSAYFTMDLKRNESNDILEEISLSGGGLGHGCGLSQNAAKQMAQGMNYKEILAYFYEGTTLGDIYE